MSANSRNGKPLAGNQGRGRYGGLSGTLLEYPTTHPTVVSIPQQRVDCQIGATIEKQRLLALADMILGKFNAARARYIALGDPQDFLAAQALADDRRALLAQIGGASWD